MVDTGRKPQVGNETGPLVPGGEKRVSDILFGTQVKI